MLGVPKPGAPGWLSTLVRSNLLLVAVPTLVAGLLCAYQIGHRSLWLDEAATVSIASQGGHALWSGIARDGGNMLVYYLIIHLVIGLFGDGATVVRLPSMLADAFTAGVVTVLGLRLFARRDVALVAGLLIAVSLPLVYWGQNARGYSLMVGLSAASFIPLLEMIRAPAQAAGASEPNRPVPRWTLFAYPALTVAAMYVGFDAVLVIPVQLALLVVFPRRTWVVIRSLLIAGACCIPLAVLAFARGSGQLFWVPPLDLHVLGQSGTTLFSAGMPPSFDITDTPIVTSGLSCLLLIGASVAALRWWRREGMLAGAWRPLLCVAWVLLPCVVAVIAALAGEPVELARCTVLLMPGLALLFAWGLLHRRVPRVAGTAAVIALLVLRMLQVAPGYSHNPEDWQAATSFVASVSGHRQTCLMFYPQDSWMPFDYYVLHDDFKHAGTLIPVLPTTPWTTIKSYVEEYHIPSRAQLHRIVVRCPRLWLVSSHEGQENGPRLSGLNYVKYQRLVSELGWVYPRQYLAVFGYAARIYTWQLSRVPTAH